jgi:hypothetical protein
MSDLIGNGVTFFIGTAGTAPAVSLTQVTDCSPDLGATNMVDTTTIGDGTKTAAPGTHEGAEFGFTLNFDPSETSHATLLANKAAKTRMSFGITTPDTGAAVFWANGYITTLTLSGGVDSVLTASVSFKADGAYTFSA